jgi:hypothetical protein
MLAFGVGRCVSLIALTALFLLFSPLLMEAAFAQSQPPPGWYRSSAAGGTGSIIHEDAQWKIVWENSYIYQHPGTDNLYWYAEVRYLNKSNQPQTLTCSGHTDLSIVKEHIRGTEGIPPDGDGYVAAEVTQCSQNPSFTGVIEPGGTHYSWAIFHNVPSGGQVRLEWAEWGFSAAWVNPWQSPFDAPPPAECPQELVNFGMCVPVSRTPAGKWPNLIVLVHGCCTDANGVREWDQLGGDIAKKLIEDKLSDKWEIVVWDWSKDTTDPIPGPAYSNADHQGRDLLAPAILSHSYTYIHMIAHSAGARLINIAAKTLIGNNKIQQDRPFIHLTFLDAYRPSPSQDDYGNLGNYKDHFSEHYVDVNLAALFTNDYLPDAFNFDITSWGSNGTDQKDDRLLPVPEFGHQWPRRWYTRSVESPSRTGDIVGFSPGFPLSLEGGNDKFCELPQRFKPGGNCQLIDAGQAANCSNILQTYPCK